MNYLRIVGIDISKAKFDVFIIRTVDGSKVTEKALSYQFNNEELEEFIKLLEPSDLCVMEATGCYHERLVYMLYKHNIAQTVINPKYSHHYTRMRGSITKTDSKDAMHIAEFGRMYHNELPLFKMPDKKALELKAIHNNLRIFKKALQVLKNQIHSREFSLLCEYDKDLKDLQDFYEQKIAELEKKLLKLVKDQYQNDYNLLMKIPGLGEVTVPSLILAYYSFIQTHKKPTVKGFCKHLGLAPMITQSGKRKARSRLGRSADPILVASLYLGTKSAITVTKKDNPMKTFANRLRERGFTFNKACTAAAHKLVRIAWAMLTTKQPYQPDHQSVKPQSLTAIASTQSENLANPNKISGAA